MRHLTSFVLIGQRLEKDLLEKDAATKALEEMDSAGQKQARDMLQKLQVLACIGDSGKEQRDQLLSRLKGEALAMKMTHVSGLVDEHNCYRLLVSLWHDAGKPTLSAGHFPDNGSESELDDFMRDRSNWSKHNLQMYINRKYELSDRNKQTKTHGIQALASLQLHTSRSYRQVLSMAVNLFSLECCNNIRPFRECLVPTDQLECLSHGHGITEFNLDLRVFETGSMLAKREKLQKLQALILGPDTGAKAPRHITISASPLSSVTFEASGRNLASIPETAVFFCFSFPYLPLVHDRADALKHILSEIDTDYSLRNDPFFNFLTVGAFIYFDLGYNIMSVAALGFFQPQPTFSDVFYTSGTLGKIYFGRHSKLPLSTIRPLARCSRWQKVTVPAVQRLRFTHFAWIKPSEFLGDHVFPKNGGFAYLNIEKWRDSKFFPLIATHDDLMESPTKDEADPELAADGDLNHEPKEFNAPLHIPEFDESDSLEQVGKFTEQAGKFISNLDISEEMEEPGLQTFPMGVGELQIASSRPSLPLTQAHRRAR